MQTASKQNSLAPSRHFPIYLLAVLLLATAAGSGAWRAWHSKSPEANRHPAPIATPVADSLSPPQAAARLAKLTTDNRQALAGLLEQQVKLTGSPLFTGNRVTLLLDGPATYSAMLRAISRAKDHIDLETYIFEAQGMGQRFADLLLRKRAQGVKVHVIYDGIGSHSTPQAFFDRMRRAGIELLQYNPLDPAQAPTSWQLNDRDHRRILCVDGKVAFTGGVNISHVYSSSSSGILRRHADVDPTQVAWRDTDVEVEGPVVAEFEKSFLSTWQRKSGHALNDARFFPPLPAVGYDTASVIASSPQIGNHNIYETYLNAINHARHSVHITQAYFVPDERFLEALTQAARRGVDVELLLPSISDFTPVKNAGRADYARLLAAGVHIFEMQKVMLHAKTAVIDGMWSTVGSSNLDYRSFRSNDEINLVVLGKPFATQLEQAFQRDLHHAAAINPQQWASRPFLQHAREDATQTLRYLF